MAVGFAVCQDFPDRFEVMLDALLATCPSKRLTPVGVYGCLHILARPVPKSGP